MQEKQSIVTTMKVLLYSEGYDHIKKSGVGKALSHQMKALKRNGVDYTLDCSESHDIIHINTLGPRSHRLARQAHDHGVKVVYHAHSTEEDFRNSFHFSNMVSPLFRRWIIKCYSLGDCIVTPTPYAKKLIQSYGITRPIFPVSNGIDLEYFQRDEEQAQAFQKKFGFSPEDKVIMAVGLYIGRKGILDFVELAKRLPQYQFIWFGFNPLWQVPHEIRKAVKTKLPNLKFPGYIDSEELRSAYWGSDLFLFPTFEETEGIVLLEALAAGCPALIRDIPIYQDWLTNDVNVYKAASVDEFERSIVEIFEGHRPPITQAAMEVAKARSLELIGQQLKEIYERCLRGEFSDLKNAQ